MVIPARRRGRARRPDLWMNGVRVGIWTVGATDDELRYDPAWVDAPAGRPLSLSRPFRPDGAALRGPAVRAWLENLLPDIPAIRELTVQATDPHRRMRDIQRQHGRA